MRKAHVLFGGWLAMKLQQGLMPLRKTHVLCGLWPKMKMQRGLRPMREAHELYGGWLPMKLQQDLMSTMKMQRGLWPPMKTQMLRSPRSPGWRARCASLLACPVTELPWLGLWPLMPPHPLGLWPTMYARSLSWISWKA